MAKQQIKLGFVDYTTLVFIPDPASTDGSGKTGLVAANLTVSGTRVETDNDVVVTDYTSSLNDLGALTTAHTDWGLKEVSSTLAPGLYRLDIADAIFASGAWSAVVYVMITTSAAAASPMEFTLVAFDINDTVRLGLTALPNAAADAAGGLVISDAGGLDADAQRADVTTILADTNDIQTRIPTALSGGFMKCDVLAISTDATAADNLELQYDGTGLTGDAFPATQAQVSGIAVTGAALNVASSSYVLTTGTQSLNTYTATAPLDGVHHEHTDTAGVLELYYQFDVTAEGSPTSAAMTGRLVGSNDSLGVYAYNWGGASWDQIGMLDGQSGTTDGTFNYTLYVSHVGTGGNDGLVRIRFYAASGLSSATLSVDQIFVSYAAVALTATGIRTAVGLASANLDTQLTTIDDFLDTEVAAIKAKTDLIPATPASTGDAMTLTSAAVDLILDDVVEGAVTLRQMIRGFASALMGKVTGMATTTVVFRDVGDTKDRITATVDADGNRSAVTKDLS